MREQKSYGVCLQDLHTLKLFVFNGIRANNLPKAKKIAHRMCKPYSNFMVVCGRRQKNRVRKQNGN